MMFAKLKRFLGAIPALLSGIILAPVVLWGAATEINFEGSGYVDGEAPPAPWSIDGTGDGLIQSGMGYTGNGLVLDDSADATYTLPQPLTQEMGSVKVSVFIKPQSGSDNFSQHGGIQLFQPDVAQVSAFFWRYNGNQEIHAPESRFAGGTNIGSWAADVWYELGVSIHEDWENVTVSVAEVDGSAFASETFAWGGQDIAGITLFRGNVGTTTVYDNFTIVPEPSTYALLSGLLSFGCVLMMRRRARRRST